VRILKILFLSSTMLLISCGELSYQLAHRGSNSQPMTSWSLKALKINSKCNFVSKKILYVEGEKRSCDRFKGLYHRVNVGSTAEMNGTMYASCKHPEGPMVAKCEIKKGSAAIVELYRGSYRNAFEVCRTSLRKSRIDEDRIAVKFLPLDYGFEQKDKLPADRYSLKIAVRWGIIKPDPPNTKGRGYLIIGREFELLTCIVEDSRVAEVKRVELAGLSQNDAGYLDYHLFFKD